MEEEMNQCGRRSLSTPSDSQKSVQWGNESLPKPVYRVPKTRAKLIYQKSHNMPLWSKESGILGMSPLLKHPVKAEWEVVQHGQIYFILFVYVFPQDNLKLTRWLPHPWLHAKGILHSSLYYYWSLLFGQWHLLSQQKVDSFLSSCLGCQHKVLCSLGHWWMSVTILTAHLGRIPLLHVCSLRKSSVMFLGKHPGMKKKDRD